MTKALKFRRAFNRKNKEVDAAINAIMAEYANDLEALAVETFGEPQADMDDPLAPPPTPVMVECSHCGRRYSSADMRLEYRPYNQPAICKLLGHDVERLEPMWWCPTERCDGAGFGFDIFPVRPSRRAA